MPRENHAYYIYRIRVYGVNFPPLWWLGVMTASAAAPDAALLDPSQSPVGDAALVDPSQSPEGGGSLEVPGRPGYLQDPPEVSPNPPKEGLGDSP